MPNEIRLWKVTEDDSLSEISQSALDLESRLQEWLARDVSVLDSGLLVIGREVETDFGRSIDLLCLDQSGDLTVIELKREKTPREVVAQALEYASWAVDLSPDQIIEIAENYLGQGSFENIFAQRFGGKIPESLNGGHRIIVVGSQIDERSERIIKYLSNTHGMNINAATFQYFRDSAGSEFLARVFLIEPSEVEQRTFRKSTSRRRPNLTFDQLEALAEESGVAELYRYTVGRLERYLTKSSTLSSLSFDGVIEGNRKRILNLIPRDSNESDGLKYQMYFYRYCEMLDITDESGLELLPTSRREWVFWAPGGRDSSGYEGYISSFEEIDRLAKALETSCPNGPST